MRLVSILHTKETKKLQNGLLKIRLHGMRKDNKGYLEESWIGKIGQN